VEAEALKADGFMVTSVFVHWDGEAEDGKKRVRFVHNLKPNKDCWGGEGQREDGEGRGVCSGS
jgi:hypothetical protein